MVISPLDVVNTPAGILAVMLLPPSLSAISVPLIRAWAVATEAVPVGLVTLLAVAEPVWVLSVTAKLDAPYVPPVTFPMRTEDLLLKLKLESASDSVTFDTAASVTVTLVPFIAPARPPKEILSAPADVTTSFVVVQEMKTPDTEQETTSVYAPKRPTRPPP